MHSRIFKPGWIVVTIFLLVLLWWQLVARGSLEFSEPLVVEEGDTLSSILDKQSALTRWRTLRAAAGYDYDPHQLEVGVYGAIEGEMSVADFYTALADGPGAVLERITVLEGWSIYDIDDRLVELELIDAGEYIEYVSDRIVIDRLALNRSFLALAPNDVRSLEGFLYPDTYLIDANQDVVAQLVGLQLQAFDQQIWLPYGNNLIARQGRERTDLSAYELLTMASVVLKEERNERYQPLVAGVFLNRVESDMRLDADITLCYGLQQGYEACTPSVIVANLTDRSNEYNTRAVPGIPPSPISSLTPGAVDAVLSVQEHDYLYYLHAPDGVLYPAEDYSGHQYNKNRYLQ